MDDTEIIDAEAREITALAVPTDTAPALAVWTPSFAVAVDEAIERKKQKRRFFEEVMDKDLHYGVIPGTGTKPALLKPGAEMLLSNMGLQPELVDAEPPIVDVLGADHGGEPFIHYRRVCKIYRQIGPTEGERMLVARAEGSCSSWEPKYRFRKGQAVCPRCGVAAIIKGKEEYGGGYVCFKKKGGCGEKFDDTDRAITSQAVGKIPNPDVVELENTILKMADKRALVAATLIATGCSDIFTQDTEDTSEHALDDERPARPRGPRAANDPPPTVTGMMTDAQRRKFRALQHDLKMSDDDAHKLMLAVTGKTSSKELTTREAGAFIDALQEYADATL